MGFKARLLHFAVIAVAAITLTAGLVVLPAAAEARSVRLVGFGDSLMAGYQLAPGKGFPEQLQAALKAKGFDVTVENAGVSGDTTSGGLARIDWSVPNGTDGVILELGANDALRGMPPEQAEKNLDEMISRLKAKNIAVLLAGMLSPPNMGPDYAARFNPIYERLAAKHKIALYPFFLEGVATDAKLKLSDGMHPTEEGVAVMVKQMLPSVETFVTSILSAKN